MKSLFNDIPNLLIEYKFHNEYLIKENSNLRNFDSHHKPLKSNKGKYEKDYFSMKNNETKEVNDLQYPNKEINDHQEEINPNEFIDVKKNVKNHKKWRKNEL